MMGEHVISSHHRESHLAVEPDQYYRCAFCVHLVSAGAVEVRRFADPRPGRAAK